MYGGFAACGNPPNGRLKTHPIGGDTRTITYDAASRITNTADTNPIYNRSFDYDVNNRLINQSDNTSFKLWSYDANSNRTQHESGSGSYAYTIAGSSNRLQTVSGLIAKSYTYDAAGNPLTDGQTTFTWDVGGKLATTLRGGKTHTYKYNALDQRISKSGPLSIRYFFFFDANGQLVGEYKDNVSTSTPTDDWLVLQETVWLENIPVAVIKKPTATSAIQTYYIHADHLNTPRVIVNTSNTVLWRWDNVHAFGANLPLEDPDNNGQTFEYNPRFPGQYFDKETNLHYNYFRYYEPETGRYISPDPIGLAGGLNVYGYAEQNPLSLVDPTGEAPPIIAGIITATVAACRAAISAIPALFSKLTKNVIDEKRVGHIFRSKKGHFSDTVENRKLLESVANNTSATLGKDKLGNTWSAQTRPDGTQVWTQMREGKIINGGINQVPRQFNSETGLPSSIKSGR